VAPGTASYHFNADAHTGPSLHMLPLLPDPMQVGSHEVAHPIQKDSPAEADGWQTCPRLEVHFVQAVAQMAVSMPRLNSAALALLE